MGERGARDGWRGGIGRVVAALWVAGLTAGAGAGTLMKEVDRFDYVLGTQTIGARYQFGAESRLVETAKAIRDMGANVIKFKMDGEYFGDKGQEVLAKKKGVVSLMTLARDEESFRTVLEMPFAYYVLWAYPFDGGGWESGFTKEKQEKEYGEMYEFARYLLKTYDGTGKMFYLGHWEGDWLLRGEGKTEVQIPPEKIENMVLWLNTRQKAIDDARRDTPHKEVEVYGYTEVNLVKIGLEGKECLANKVLPRTKVDYVSYSAYDTMDDPVMLKRALDYIEGHLPAKEGVEGKRVFIGEYGFPAERYTPGEQEEKSRKVMRAGLEWGCPFVLYWEMYNNEVDQQGRQRGFWLIDDKGVKQPVYWTMEGYLKESRKWVGEFVEKNHRQPMGEEFRQEAARVLAGGPVVGR